jgi:CMP-N,N'-diacetyllegionaminic acid synthase
MKIKNEIWCFIPARSGSKTIKHKNLYKIRGKELIKYSVGFAKKSNLFHKIIFSSDSVRYFNVIKKFKSIEFHHRNKKISKDKTTDLEVFQDYLKIAEKKFKYLPKYFAHLRPTTPLRKKNYVIEAIKKIKRSPNITALRAVSPMSNPSFKTMIIQKNRLYSITGEKNIDKFNKPRQLFKKTYLPNGYIDILKTETILKKSFHGNNVLPFIIDQFNSDIDDINDAFRVETFLKKYENRKHFLYC